MLALWAFLELQDRKNLGTADLRGRHQPRGWDSRPWFGQVAQTQMRVWVAHGHSESSVLLCTGSIFIRISEAL